MFRSSYRHCRCSCSALPLSPLPSNVVRRPHSTPLLAVHLFAGGAAPAAVGAPALPRLRQGHMRSDLLPRPSRWRQHAPPDPAAPRSGALGTSAAAPYRQNRPEGRRDGARFPPLRARPGDQLRSITSYHLISSMGSSGADGNRSS
ncbi:uncharacterized protein [Triticum aestivum]|uniref:uncharacterized protein isoform X2 n=1 Tax=Triticum aestivum TaxID=4565 RepID=UPI000844801E|nr:uncharacterized protein LOC123180356 isoform X2 [Triticum aestivum]